MSHAALAEPRNDLPDGDLPPAGQAQAAAARARRAEQEHILARVLDERARIAREIHDILAHTLGDLAIQIEAAQHLLAETGDIQTAGRLLDHARHLTNDGLTETRRAITALRTGPVALPEALATLAAADGGLVSQQVRGSPRQLAPQAGLAVYRTAQEALANARKHAPGAPVLITLCFTDQAVVLRVTNPTLDMHPAGPLAATGGGYGLAGLTERAKLLGGTLRAGPGPDGWAVELRIPARAEQWGTASHNDLVCPAEGSSAISHHVTRQPGLLGDLGGVSA